MSCEVSLTSGEDGDYPDFFDDRTVKARKPHKCLECRCQIDPGASYRRVTGKWSGEFDSFSICLPCWWIQHEFADGGTMFGTLWDDFSENWSSGSNIQACIARMPGAENKAKLRLEWLRYKKLVDLAVTV